jgi:adenosylmethionine-8-amino-7-oxononanoate aminotransferase
MFLALGGAVHGTTIGALSVGDGSLLPGSEVLDPLRFPVVRSPGYADARWLEHAIRTIERHEAVLAAVVVEPLLQLPSGVWPTSPEALNALGWACQEHDVLLVCDESATAFGRTGAMLASVTCGLTPDLLCVGSSLAGGCAPLAAVVATGSVLESAASVSPGLVGSAPGLGAAVAVAVRHHALLAAGGEAALLTGAAAGDRLAEGLASAGVGERPGVVDVRRCGLAFGVQLSSPAAAVTARSACAAAGVLVGLSGPTLVLTPPLTTTPDEVDAITAAVASSL